MKCRDERGFTLLEVVIAFAILALSFAALYQSLGETMHRFGQSGLEREAWAEAQALLTATPLLLVEDESAKSGTSDQGFDWQIQIASYEEIEDLRQLTIEVRWGERENDVVKLTSLRLRPQ